MRESQTQKCFLRCLTALFLLVPHLAEAEIVRRLEVHFSQNGGRWVLESSPPGQPRQALEIPIHVGHETVGAPMFSGFGLLFLIAPHMPQELQLDFPILKPIRRILNAMYALEGLAPPVILGPPDVEASDFAARLKGTVLTDRSVIAYSAGKNSMWNYL